MVFIKNYYKNTPPTVLWIKKYVIARSEAAWQSPKIQEI